MREIKFRAWDVRSGKCRKVADIDFTLKKIELFGDGGVGEWQWLDDVVLEQYTGVDDANNIPIYEGDIIRGLFTADEGLTLDGDRITYFGQVEWCSQSNCLGWYVESQDGGMFELEQCHAKISLDNITGEVVGNVHTDIKLLNGDD